MRSRKYDIRKEHLEQMRAAGMGTHAIADVYGCDQSNVRYWLIKFGLETRQTITSQRTISDEHVSNAIDKFRRVCARDPYCKKAAYGQH